MNFRNRSIVALLPMKAHSERVPNKNFRDFNGKPLFRWILDTLLLISEITEVVINTDARSILAEHGLADSDRVRIRDRKPELCGDFVSMNRVLEDDIANVPADVYVMTHTTNPLLSAATIKAALSLFEQEEAAGNADSLFTVNKFQTRFYRQDASPVNHDPTNLVRTQDLEPWFEENSNLYIFTQESFARTNARIGERPLLFETPKLESIDIDDQADWELAVAVAKSMQV
ncbi:acylneuraminate cytidylyltransferase [Methylocaldum marinum]|uniref:Acylneuraminate cytidylyltransferase n=1 Tax=Methylocaldum marinum TaxID=1432792 RepID=A0A250KNV9_9GAMM|nr:acylneuraminate cytidylyltransferase family protein [Methylocaldum marinum]BBA33365.1 acylneuraminate cytidylyltransferase [Methylocaldum marinum]